MSGRWSVGIRTEGERVMEREEIVDAESEAALPVCDW